MEGPHLKIVKNIDIKKGPQGYGFIISNQKPCVVSCVSPDGPAELAGLKVNDGILQVNGINVGKMNHEEVVRMILRCTGTFLHLMVHVGSDRDDGGKSYVAEAGDPSHNKSPTLGDTETPTKGEPEVIVIEPKLPVASHDNFSRTRPVSIKDIAVRERFKKRYGHNFETCRISSTDDSTMGHSDNSKDDSSLSCANPNIVSDSGVKLISIEWQKENVNVSRTLYPVLAPVNKDETDHALLHRVIVGYLCTIELPGESFLPSTSINAITNCVKRLNKANKKASNNVMMTFSPKGVALRNSDGVDIVAYPLKALAFSGTCPSDKRYFGIVTRKTLQSGPKRSPLMSPKLLCKRKPSSKTVICSCHVFIVDSELADHDVHQEVAEQFGFTCTRNTDFGGCKEFPPVSSVVLYALNSLFRERNSGEESSDCEMDWNVSGRAVNSKPRAKSESRYVQRSYSTDELASADRSRDNVQELRDIEKQRIKEELDSCRNSIIESSKSSPSLFSRFMSKSSAGWRSSKYSPKPLPRTVSHDTGTNMYIAVNNNNRKTNDKIHLESEGSISSLVDGSQEEEYQLTEDYSAIVVQPYATPIRSDSLSPKEEKEVTFKSFIKESPLLRKKTRSKRKKVTQPDSFSDSDFETGHGPARSSSIENDMNAGNCKTLSGEGSGAVIDWAKSLETLLADPVGIKYFQEFLKKEFSEENIIFWKECERLKLLTQEDEVASLANQIYDRHLAEGAPLLVNVDQQAVKKAKEVLDQPSPNVFELQQQQIFKLMKFDSFPRFLKSDVYNQCLLLAQQGRLDSSDDESKRGKTVWYVRKSKSNAKDLQDAAERKRSILGFLSKGGKGGRQDVHVKQSRSHSVASFSDSSRRSSMASLPDILDYRNSLTKLLQEENEAGKSDLQHSCKVIFPSGSLCKLPTNTGQNIREALATLCEKENTRFSAYVVLLGKERKTIDVDKKMSDLRDQVLYLEKKVQFRFDLPNCRSVGIETSPGKTLREVIQPVLERNGYLLKDFVVTKAGSRSTLNLDSKVVDVENKHLCSLSLEYIRRLRQSTGAVNGKPPLGDFRSSIKRVRNGPKSDDETFLKPFPADLKPVRSDESLCKPGRGPRKSLSNLKPKEKKANRNFRSQSVDLAEDSQSDLVDVLVRTSSGRIDDQRGTIPKEELELPDFLKQDYVQESDQCSKFERQRSLSSGAVITPAQQRQMSDIDPDEFRPAAEVLAECSFTSLCDRPSLYSVQSWSELPSPDRFNMRASSPKACALGKELDRELAFLGRLSVGSRCNGRDVSAAERSRLRGETVDSQTKDQTFYISDDEEEKNKKVLSGYSKQNRHSLNSLTSSENEDSGSEQSLLAKCASVGSPRSPVQKQQKLESRQEQPPCFIVPQSPVCSRGKLVERKLKPRPLALTGVELELMLGRDCPQNSKNSTQIDGPVSDNKVYDSSANGDQPVTKRGSDTTLSSPFDIIEVEDEKKSSEQINGSDVVWKTNLQRTDSNVSDASIINTSVTATGSVNDETVILEDKDMSLGLLNLIQRKRLNKGRRFQEQSSLAPDREKLLNGETIRGRKNERITFV